MHVFFFTLVIRSIMLPISIAKFTQSNHTYICFNMYLICEFFSFSAFFANFVYYFYHPYSHWTVQLAYFNAIKITLLVLHVSKKPGSSWKVPPPPPIVGLSTPLTNHVEAGGGPQRLRLVGVGGEAGEEAVQVRAGQVHHLQPAHRLTSYRPE